MSDSKDGSSVETDSLRRRRLRRNRDDAKRQSAKDLSMEEWTKRRGPRRDSLRVARMYSRFVLLMKIALPLAALALVITISTWPKLRDVGRVSFPRDKGRLEMSKARYMSLDAQGRPFSVIAERATQDVANQDIVNLIGPVTEVTQKDGNWVTMRSDRGRFDQKSGYLLLLDNVHLLRDDGFEFTTALAHIDTKAGEGWGDRHVVGQGPSGEINADGFRMMDQGQTIIFTNRAETAITGAAAAASGKSPGGATGSSALRR
ncbi:lipopolysaccharide export system protein LptC [Azospirillaceae bacterium]